LRYVELIKKFADEIYEGLSSGKEKISIDYSESALTPEQLFDRLKQARDEDIMNGTTSVGPHRDDLFININGHSARAFGSQGQQRSAALTLKLCEAAIIKKVSGQQPIALLDDVMSELDLSRQDYILNHIKEWQVFITCCDINTAQMLHNGYLFNVENGCVSREGE
jgi:DNA replication and repair protein RecF